MPHHFEQRLLPYTQEQLFALVADVEKYPSFLPWCKKVIVNKMDGHEMLADMTVGYGGFRETFTSIVTLNTPLNITVKYGGGPLKTLHNEWRFESNPKGCILSFYVDFSVRSIILSSIMDVFFNKAFLKMVTAFEDRAQSLYGKKN